MAGEAVKQAGALNGWRPESATVDDRHTRVEEATSSDESDTNAMLETLESLREGSIAVDNALATGEAIADRLGLDTTLEDVAEADTTTASVGGSIIVVARGVIIAVVALIVLSALYSTDIVSNPENNNTWTQMFDTFAGYGSTAFTLIGVGLIAVGAGVALSYFGNMGGGGGR